MIASRIVFSVTIINHVHVNVYFISSTWWYQWKEREKLGQTRYFSGTSRKLLQNQSVLARQEGEGLRKMDLTL